MQSILENTVDSRIGNLTIMVDASNNCQLACKYCYFGQKRQWNLYVTGVFKGITNFICSRPSPVSQVQIHYMGGEPLLAWSSILQLNELLRKFFMEQGIKFKWSLTSNLLALTDERADHMISEGAGIHCSLDGPADIQARNRPMKNGSSSFDLAVRNVPVALRITPNDTLRVTVCPQDAARLPEIVSFGLDLGFKYVGLFPAFNMEWEEKTMHVFSESLRVAVEKNPPDDSGRSRVKTIVRNAPERSVFNYCGAGTGLWAFDVRGQLYHCHHLTNQPNMAIVDAANSSPEDVAKACQQSQVAPPTHDIQGVCAECPARHSCNGGCWASNLMSNGDATKPESVSCKMRRLAYDALSGMLKTDRQIHACWLFCDGCEGCQGCDSDYCTPGSECVNCVNGGNDF